ncbi:MAG: hypothetical protein J6T15_05230 [Bacilli bacterium]|nr:hypothetical protein [Bacilli bacterium]
MGRTFWSKMNRKSKDKKDSYEISKKTNIPEEKVDEILNGDRELPSDKVDVFVKTLKENTKLERQVEVERAKKWILETDLKAVRESYNFKSQRELCGYVKLDNATINRIENKHLEQVTGTPLIKYYDFFHNELNKKVDSKRKEYKPRRKKRVVPTMLYKDSETSPYVVVEKVNNEETRKDEIINWYENFNFKKYLTDNNLTRSDLACSLGYSPKSMAMVSGLINHTVKPLTTGSKVIEKAYDFFNTKNKAQKSPVDEEKVVKDKLTDKSKKVDYEEVVEVKDSNISKSPLIIEEKPMNKSLKDPINNYVNDLQEELKKSEEIIKELKEENARKEEMLKGVGTNDVVLQGYVNRIKELEKQLFYYERLIDLIDKNKSIA